MRTMASARPGPGRRGLMRTMARARAGQAMAQAELISAPATSNRDERKE
jgi:hypothetical protein